MFRATLCVCRVRLAGVAVLLALIPAALAIPAVTTLALASAVCWLIVAYEGTRHREARARLRRGEQPKLPDA